VKRPAVFLAAVLALDAAVHPAAGAAPGVVDASGYDAFWLWAGVAPQPVLAKARTLYLLRGQVSAANPGGGAAVLIAQGGSTPHIRPNGLGEKVWIAYRVHTLDWTPAIYSEVLAELSRWEAAGNPVAGVQIDFDAHTRHLDQYVTFLKQLRARLPPRCKLSITGLMDWGSHADPAALSGLGGVVDEVVLQTYQGRATIPNYQAYLSRLSRVRFSFKIGLVQGGAWSAPASLTADPWFRGYVVFLRNPGTALHRRGKPA
jgi:hypothetical protein